MKATNLWFTADSHFSHKNILKYCDRGMKTIKDHDNILIANWNKRIKPTDDIFHLGDFALCGAQRCRDILNRLNGHIHLIRGNHDKVVSGSMTKRFVWVKDYYELTVEDDEIGSGHKQSLILFHYPIESWHKKFHGAWHLHGHCHGNLTNQQPARLDICVDCHRLGPLSYEEIKVIITRRLLKKGLK